MSDTDRKKRLRKKPDPKKHNDIRVPDEEVKNESFKNALKKSLKK